MDEPQNSGNIVRQSQSLLGVSRERVALSKVIVETAKERLDRARNAVQLAWLLRELQKRTSILRRRARGGRGGDAAGLTSGPGEPTIPPWTAASSCWLAAQRR